jgi:hypothetical protein
MMARHAVALCLRLEPVGRRSRGAWCALYDKKLVMTTSTFSSAVAQASAAGPEPVWIVPLREHRHYDYVRLKRVFGDEDDTRHCVVLVDAARLLQCADRDDTDYVLPPVGDWHAGKKRGIREFLDPQSERIPTMPYVTIVSRRAPGLLGWLGIEHEGVVTFRNGQHRARYLAYAGAEAFPVEVHEREAALLKAMCGASPEQAGLGDAS